MKRKGEKTKQKNEVTGFNFVNELAALNNLGSTIRTKHCQPSQKDAAKVKELIAQYGRQSDAFSHANLSEKQQSELKKVRDAHREEIDGIKGKLKKLIDAQKAEVQQTATAFEQQRNKVQQAATKIPGLFEQLNAAADAFVEASTATIDKTFQTFKSLRMELQQTLRELPSTRERKEYFKTVDVLSKKVKDHQEQVDKSLREMEAHTQEQVAANREKVDQVASNGGSLLEILFSAAPENMQKALKKVMGPLKNNMALFALLGSEGVKQITSGNTEGALAPISEQNQIAALEIILNELSRDESLTSKDVALARQFLGTIVTLAKGAQELQRGEKEYATFVTQVGGFVNVMHVRLQDLLNDPQTIGNVFSTFLRLGVTQPLHMQFTSRKEAAAISVVMNNVDTKTLTSRMGSLSQDELFSLTQGNMNGALVNGSHGELALTQAKTLPQITALVAQSAHHIGALVQVLGNGNPELVQQLTLVMSQLDIHYANKPTTAFTSEETFRIIKELVIMGLTAPDINDSIIRQEGAIGAFVASSLCPKVPLGNTIMLMDQSLQFDPTGGTLILGMGASTPLLVAEGQDKPTFPLTITPPSIVQNEVLVFNKINAIEQQKHLAELALKETRAQFDLEKDQLRYKLAQKLIEVTGIHREQKQELEKEIAELKAQLSSLASSSEQTISRLEKQLKRLTKEHQQELRKQVKETKNILQEMTVELDAEKIQLQHQLDENLKAVTHLYQEEQQILVMEIERLKLQLSQLESTREKTIKELQAQLQLATELHQEQLIKQQQVEDTLKEAQVERERLQHDLGETLQTVSTLYEEEADDLRLQLSHSEERIRQLEQQLQQAHKIADNDDFEQKQLIEELLNAQPATSIDLRVQAAQYEGFLKEFEKICNVLQVKESADPVYADVTDAAEDVYQILSDVGEDFFTNPTPETFASFKAICKESMAAAAVEFKQHRDLWPSIHPIFRGILGVIATLTVIPALVVAAASKQGYLGSFFSTPETESAKKLSRVQSQFEEIEHDIAQNMQVGF